MRLLLLVFVDSDLSDRGFDFVNYRTSDWIGLTGI